MLADLAFQLGNPLGRCVSPRSRWFGCGQRRNCLRLARPTRTPQSSRAARSKAIAPGVQILAQHLYLAGERAHILAGEQTGRLVVADEAGPTCGASAEICALVTEDPQTFRALKAPVRRVCALEAPIPYTPVLDPRLPEPRPHRQRGARGGDGRVTQARSAFPGPRSPIGGPVQLQGQRRGQGEEACRLDRRLAIRIRKHQETLARAAARSANAVRHAAVGSPGILESLRSPPERALVRLRRHRAAASAISWSADLAQMLPRGLVPTARTP